MRNKLYIKIISIFLIFFYSNVANAEIKNKIIAKVGKEIITSFDLENRIRTIIYLNGFEFNQENINNTKNAAIKSLIQKSIKQSELKRFKVKDYSVIDLENYLADVSKSKQLQRSELKNAFKEIGIDYNKFVESHRVELLWQTLIFDLYKNQLTVNSVEVENEFKKKLLLQKNFKEYKISEIEVGNNEMLGVALEMIRKDGFEQSARKISISNSSSDGGLIGWFPEQSLSKKYLEELEKLNKGDITNPIRTQNSIIILKINDIKIVKNENLDLEELKKQIIVRIKNNKLKLFSRSHFSNLENTTLIDFL